MLILFGLSIEHFSKSKCAWKNSRIVPHKYIIQMHTRIDRRRAAIINVGNLGFQSASKPAVSDKGNSTLRKPPVITANSIGMGMWRTKQELASSVSG